MIESTISARSQKKVSCTGKISSTNIISHDTSTLKLTEQANSHALYPNNFNHEHSPKPDFEVYRNNGMKENQNF
jgi:hypothetical protein